MSFHYKLRLRKACLGWLLGLGLPLASGAQSPRILPPVPDSLRAPLRAAPAGEARIRVLLRIADAYTVPFDSAGVVEYTEAAEREARQARLPELVGEALAFRGDYYRLAANLPRAQALFQQAAPLLTTAPRAMQAQFRYHWGMLYSDLNQPSRAFALYSEAEQLAEDNDRLRGDLLNSRGLLYLAQNRLDSAAVNLFRSARLLHRMGQREPEAAALSNLALVYGQQKRWGEAIAFTRRGLAIESALGDTISLSVSWHNLGVLLVRRDSARAGLPYLRKALRVRQQQHLNGELPSSWTNLARAYEQLGQIDSARYCFGQVLAQQQQMGRPKEIGDALQVLANFYLRQHQWAQAEALGQQVLALPVRQVDVLTRVGIYGLLNKVAAHRHDFAAAYAWQTRELHLNDSLRTLADARVTEEQRARFETDHAEAQVRNLTQRQQVDDLRRQRLLLWALLGAVLLLAGGALGLLEYRRRRLRRELALRTRLSADLHDEVGGLLTQISMQTDLLGAGLHEPEQQKGLLREVAATSRLAASQLQDVVWSFDARNDAVGSLLDRLRDHAYEVLQYGEATITFDATPGATSRTLPVETRRALYLIFKEALTNIRKHAPRGTHIQVALHADARTFTLSIADDGFPPATNGHIRASGHGRRNMQARAEAVGGTCRTGFGAVPGQPGFGVLVEVPVG
ncbi:tetratricopeptide repeat-containing sensor histidine kinase [Hymenobacter rubidus]|uniref:tetratricopeptide repeat-containing sensor histidine kinase n=1 Tax=Hymenobacter rubidus TaxID=1441626 RepID=UPI00191D64F4|nr:tetratricopeptide repeat protein [Hymenobacter rubidus]